MDTTQASGGVADRPVGVFANTHWSVVTRAKEVSAVALNALCLACRSPLIIWLRRRGEKPEYAEDCVQGLFEHLLSHGFLRGVAREKGRFRTFLLGALQNRANHRDFQAL
jgi:DNA-directed RNA polymerase specialized sigma24 family protein